MTRAVCKDKKSRAIVQSIIELATKLDVATCAEGIEDDLQAQTLASMNCSFGQGYLFSEPLSAVQFTHFLAMRCKAHLRFTLPYTRISRFIRRDHALVKRRTKLH